MAADHLFKIGVGRSAICPGRQEVEDSLRHLLIDCPKYLEGRRRFYCDEEGISILTQKPEPVCNYLKKIGRFTSQATIAKVGRVEETPRIENNVISPLLDREEM